MANYLLDTNHAAALVTLGHPLRQRVLLRLQAGDTFAIAVPVVAETLYGIGLLPRAAQNLAEWAKLRPSLACYIPDEHDRFDLPGEGDKAVLGFNTLGFLRQRRPQASALTLSRASTSSSRYFSKSFWIASR